MKKYKLNGLDCADCALKLERELSNKEYVKDVSISFTTKTMIIDTDNMYDVEKTIKNLEPEIVIQEANATKADIDAKHEILSLDKDKYIIIISLGLFLIGFFAEILQKYFNFDYEMYIFFIPLYVISYLIVGIPILVGAYNSIKTKNFFNEKVLMSISTISAFMVGYFEEACGVMIFYSIGEYFQNLALINSRKDIKNLLELKDRTVNLIINENEEIETINIEDVNEGMYILVKAGEKVPLDGIIVKGVGEFNLSNITGESIPKNMEIGDTVYSGSINISSNIVLKVINKYEKSSMFKLVELIENSMHKKTRVDKFITTFSRWYTPFVIILAVLVAIIPLLFIQNISFEKSLYSAIILLVIACPCALVLSIPLTYFNAVGNLAKTGILIKDISIFDVIEKVDTLFLDKTGTVTEGNFDVSEINTYFDDFSELTEKQILEYVYIAEKGSNHPIAKSIIKFISKKYYLSKLEYEDVYLEYISYCKHCGCCHKPVEHNETTQTFIEEYRHHIGHYDEDKCNSHEYKFNEKDKDSGFAKNIVIKSLNEIAGQGIKLLIKDYEILVGNDIMMKSNKVSVPESAKNVPNEYGTNVNVAINGKYVMNIYVKDIIKKDSKQAIKDIRKNNISNIILLTGDTKQVALEVKNKLNIDECYYNLLPKDKLDILEKHSKTNKVMFLGDGINDAPAIARADVGIAMGKKGSDIAIGTADVVFTTDSISKVSLLKKYSKKMKYIIYENISIILLVKFIVILFGITGKANLWVAVFGDVGITILAILNSKRIKNI